MTEQREWPPALRLLTDLGAGLGAVTAVLYYFGWVHTTFRMRALGFDVSALELTTTDYLLKSLNVLFLPLVLLAVGVLVLHSAHRRLLAPRIADPARRPGMLRIARLLGWAWAPLAVVALGLLLTPMTTYAVPLALTASVLLGYYGRAIRRAAGQDEPWTVPLRVIMAVLLALGVFWTTERVARSTGELFGRDFADAPEQLPAVVVYSAKDLLLGGPGVTEESMPDPKAAYEFRYSGLYLLERSGDRFFFLTGQAGRVIVLRESDGVRMEFVRAG